MSAFTADPYVRIYNRLADGGEICSGGFDPKNDPDDRRKLWLVTLAAAAFIIMFVIFSSCTRHVYIPVERSTTRYVTVRDTVVEISLEEVHDTTTVEITSGDTLSYLHNGLSYSYASIVDGKLGHSLGTLPGAKVRDSVKVIHTHTVDSIPYPVRVEVEKKLSMWQRLKMEYGGFAMGAAAALAGILLLVIASERRKRD